MAIVSKLAWGRRRRQVRRKAATLGDFLRHGNAVACALRMERRTDRGDVPGRRAKLEPTFGRLIDLHVDDMRDVGRAPRRSKPWQDPVTAARSAKW